MRTIIVLLLLANLSLFGYIKLDQVGGGEGVRLTQQVLPDKIRLLSPREVAALGPSKVAALADVCVEWGPFSDADRTRAMNDLTPLALGTLLSQRRQDVSGAFGVMADGFVNRSAAERRATELRARDIGEVTVQDLGKGQFGLLFGVFHSEDAAKARIALLGVLRHRQRAHRAAPADAVADVHRRARSAGADRFQAQGPAAGLSRRGFEDRWMR